MAQTIIVFENTKKYCVGVLVTKIYYMMIEYLPETSAFLCISFIALSWRNTSASSSNTTTRDQYVIRVEGLKTHRNPKFFQAKAPFSSISPHLQAYYQYLHTLLDTVVSWHTPQHCIRVSPHNIYSEIQIIPFGSKSFACPWWSCAC